MDGSQTSYEKALSNYMFQDQVEKSFTDKVLNREDNKRLQELMKQTDLDEDDIHEILHLISTTGNKLANFNDWDRYLLGKDFAWIREFGTHCVNVMNWELETKQKIQAIEDLMGNQIQDPQKAKPNPNDHDAIADLIDGLGSKAKKPDLDSDAVMKKYVILNQTLETIQRIKQDVIHNFKFMVDVFDYLSSSTLSLGAAAFDKLTSARFEYHYPNMDQMGDQQPKKSFSLNLRRK